MSEGRLLLDEMISPRVADQLRRRGHDVIAIAERPDLVGMSDDEVLTVAAEEERVVVTRDIGDFARLAAALLREGRSHSGLLYLAPAFPSGRAAVGALVRSLDAVMHAGHLPRPDEEGFLLRPPG